MDQTAQSSTNTTGVSDFRSFFFLDPAPVRKYSADLRATNSPQNIELADLLDATPDSTFSLTENQKKLGALLEKLQQKGASDDIIRDFTYAVFQVIYNKAVSQLSSTMTGDIRAYWDEVMQTNPNMFQIIALLNFYTKVAFDQEIDEYIDGIIAQVVEEYSQAIEKEQNVEQNLMSLPEEKMKQVNQLLADGEVDEALVLMFSNQTPVAVVPEVPPENNQDIRM